MAELSYWARGDSSSANNASVNSQGTTTTVTTELTFTSGTSGNLELDYNGGLPDPDTQVIIGGQTYDFTVQFSGALPSINKLSNVAGTDVRGAEITVIEIETGQRYYFMTDGSGTFAIMDDMPNGAIPIENVNANGPVLICFAADTLIETTDGERPVQALQVGDLVITEDGSAKPIRWIGQRSLSAAELIVYPNLRPVCIPANTFGAGAPHTDLYLSRQHRIVVQSWEVELLFGYERALVSAGNLVGKKIHVTAPGAPVTYYHIYFDDHEVVRSNGLWSESFQPGKRGIDSLDDAVRAEFLTLFGDVAAPGGITRRTDAFLSLRRHEASLLAPLAA